MPTDPSSGEFPFLRGSCWRGRGLFMLMCECLPSEESILWANLRTLSWYVPSQRRPSNFQPSRGPAFLGIYICGWDHTMYGREQ
jgi:hypothetical protein